MIFSVTERGEWLRCRRSHHYNSFNRLGLELIIPPLALETGKLWHHAHEQWCNHPEMSFKHHIWSVSSDELDSIQAAYKTRIGVAASDEEVQVLYDAVHQLDGMATRYQEHWESPIPKGFEKISIEQTFIVPVSGSTHSYEATFDGLMRNIKTQKLWVLERKTFGQWPNEKGLNTTEQFLDYLWILDQVCKLGMLDFECEGVGGIFYDGAYKSGPKTRKQPQELFMRLPLTRTRYELDNHAQTIAMCLNEMAADQFTGTHHPMYNRYYTCDHCKFTDLCRKAMLGENTETYIATKMRPRKLAGFALNEN